MTAWQYFAGAGLVAALCPLHGHVEVAGDGHGRGARVDLCVPAGTKPVRPSAVPPHGRPSVRAIVPGPVLPTVWHPGAGPLPVPPGAVLPGLAGPTAKAGEAPSKPPPPGPGAGPVAAPAAPEAVVPAAVEAPAAPVRRFHVRPYHSSALARRGPDGMSTVMLMAVVTTPAVLAAAALRPRGKSRG
ncbi:hypothetical protein [Streptomyces sp. NPDC051183]|uniref:hypothetical protein n=1 Tax=unclassified Streptomyces TaxID=2593676 RepID=UPI00344969DF